MQELTPFGQKMLDGLDAQLKALREKRWARVERKAKYDAERKRAARKARRSSSIDGVDMSELPEYMRRKPGPRHLKIEAMYNAGKTIDEISAELGLVRHGVASVMSIMRRYRAWEARHAVNDNAPTP